MQGLMQPLPCQHMCTCPADVQLEAPLLLWNSRPTRCAFAIHAHPLHRPMDKDKDNERRMSSWCLFATPHTGQSQRGDPYSRWTVTDLSGTSATLFVFGAAQRDHYKESEGSVLILAHPKVCFQWHPHQALDCSASLDDAACGCCVHGMMCMC